MKKVKIISIAMIDALRTCYKIIEQGNQTKLKSAINIIGLISESNMRLLFDGPVLD